MNIPMNFLPDDVVLFRLLLSALLGGAVGLHRELHGKPAGLRTHILVCVGSTLFTLVSLALPVEADVGRIAANIVVGIGFLGAGSIFRSRTHVSGLTTAADLWVVAAIGLAVGVNYVHAAVVSTVLVLVVLTLGKFASTLIDFFRMGVNTHDRD